MNGLPEHYLYKTERVIFVFNTFNENVGLLVLKSV